MAEGWQHFGKDYLYEQAVAGVESLQLQAPSVRVGHTHYIVTSA
ncbi:hypothetical protein FHX69_2563 [Prauserella muralis]|nr:hypothetical protein FHX69_2563 [Prauserella muralis]